MLKKRNPFISYILLWLTCGVYLFYWLFATMKEVNIIASESIFNVRKKLIILFSILIPEFIIILIFQYYPRIFESPLFGLFYSIGAISGLAWLTMVIVYYAQIGKVIGRLELKHNIEKPTSGGKAVLFFFL